MEPIYVERFKDLAGFAVWISLLLVPTIAAAKAHIPGLSGWKTLVTSLAFGLLIVGLLVKPVSVSQWLDAGLVGLMSALIAVGGDSYLFRVLSKVKAPAVLPMDRPTVPPAEFPRTEAPTRPDHEEIKL
ncbi:MAG: hypothetical protein WC565_04165 [Parcubacteria group bacterium]